MEEPVLTASSGSTPTAVSSPSTSLERRQLLTLGVLAALLVVCYAPMLSLTGRILLFSDDMAHGFFAPLIALFLVWDGRRALLNPVARPSAWALLFIGFAAFVGTVAVLGNSSTFSRFAFLFSLAGCLLLLGGWPMLRRFSFPLCLLLFTFPVPDVFYGEITQPLQLLATRISEGALELLGFSVIREGNVLQLTHMKLSVVEACSGLRSLITLFFFCLIYGYFFEPRLWLRAVVVALSIPSAIAINAVRITLTGVLGKYDMKWTSGTPHEIVGWAAFSVGFLFVWGAHRLIRATLHAREPVKV